MASVTKSFTALSIMQMQQDGLLKVDDPVSRYIPEFTNKNQSEPVAVAFDVPQRRFPSAYRSG